MASIALHRRLMSRSRPASRLAIFCRDFKSKAVAAQADDLTSDQRAALQVDFASLRSQIDTIANAAQFNGANLATGSASLNVLISDLGGSTAATTDGVQSAALTTPLSGSALVIDAGSATGDLADGDLITFDLTDFVNAGTSSISVELTAGMTIDGSRRRRELAIGRQDLGLV